MIVLSQETTWCTRWRCLSHCPSHGGEGGVCDWYLVFGVQAVLWVEIMWSFEAQEDRGPALFGEMGREGTAIPRLRSERPHSIRGMTFHHESGRLFELDQGVSC